MTDRLYYSDSTLREFKARIVGSRESQRGMAIRLNRTAFYPTSGGQPHDRGTLDGVAVLDVWEDDMGDVWHLVEHPLRGDEVRGVIDWERRFDHMQQHSGQHLLSAGLVRLLDTMTLSFHLGQEESTIDLDTPELDWESAFRVEAEVNCTVWENRPVEIHVFEQEEIHKVPLRKPPTVSGSVRVIWVPEYDVSACGGTHVGRTGTVGLVKITRIERYKGGVRVGFRCGQRALRDYQRALRGLQAASAELSVHPDGLGATVERLRAECKETRHLLKAARSELTVYEAERLWGDTPEVAGLRQVVAHLENRSFEEARAIASRLTTHPRTLALLAVSEAKGTRLVCARSSDLPGLNAAAILGRAAGALDGRGGGSASLAQAGAPAQSGEAIWEALRSATSH